MLEGRSFFHFIKYTQGVALKKSCYIVCVMRGFYGDCTVYVSGADNGGVVTLKFMF